MPNQTQKQNYSFPDGLRFEVSIDGGSSYLDVGVMAQGANMTFNFDKVIIEPGNAAKPQAKAKNMTVAIEPTALWSWDTSTMIAISGGLFVQNDVAGSPVTGGLQQVAASYTYDKAIELTGQNASGAVPSTIVVTEDPTGTPVVLTVNTDYKILKNAENKWSVFILSTGSANNTLPFQVSSDYTPAATVGFTAGTSSKLIDSSIVRFRHYTNTALTTWDFEFIVYKADLDAGLVFNKKGVNEDGVDEWTLSLTGDIDDSLADNAQLFSLALAA